MRGLLFLSLQLFFLSFSLSPSLHFHFHATIIVIRLLPLLYFSFPSYFVCALVDGTSLISDSESVYFNDQPANLPAFFLTLQSMTRIKKSLSIGSTKHAHLLLAFPF